MRIGVLRGREFTDADNKQAPRVAMINQTMVEKFWPHEDPIGKRFSMDGTAGPFAEVIGVTRNGKYQAVGEDAQAFFYSASGAEFRVEARIANPYFSSAGIAGITRRGNNFGLGAAAFDH